MSRPPSLTGLPNPPLHGTLGDSYQLWDRHRGLCFPPLSDTPLSTPSPPPGSPVP